MCFKCLLVLVYNCCQDNLSILALSLIITSIVISIVINVMYLSPTSSLSLPSSSSLSCYTPAGSGTDPGVGGVLASCLKEVIKLATLIPLCYHKSYWAEL